MLAPYWKIADDLYGFDFQTLIHLGKNTLKYPVPLFYLTLEWTDYEIFMVTQLK